MFGSKLAKSYKKGQELKEQARMLLNLTPEENAIFDQGIVRAVPQSYIDKNFNQDINFNSPGYTTHTPQGVQTFINENLPYIPKLTYGNASNLYGKISNLPAYITEKDLIAHEMGHNRDLRENGVTSEPRAIAFEHGIVNRGQPRTAARGMTLREAFLSRLESPDDWDTHAVIFPKQRSRYL